LVKPLPSILSATGGPALFEDFIGSTPPCHAQIADLIALGFEVVGAEPNQRGVRFNGDLYLEGYLEALVVEGDKQRKAAGLGRPNGSKRPAQPN
jgi:hypothetical protein